MLFELILYIIKDDYKTLHKWYCDVGDNSDQISMEIRVMNGWITLYYIFTNSYCIYFNIFCFLVIKTLKTRIQLYDVELRHTYLDCPNSIMKYLPKPHVTKFSENSYISIKHVLLII